jgi:hypothetical protein
MKRSNYLIATALTSVVCLLICFGFNYWQLATGALENTRWKGIINAPGPVKATLEFHKDTLLLTYQGEVIETMNYQTDANTLTLKKLSGGSPCGSEAGQYKYSINKDLLVFSLIKDECNARSSSFSVEGYEKQP